MKRSCFKRVNAEPRLAVLSSLKPLGTQVLRSFNQFEEYQKKRAQN